MVSAYLSNMQTQQSVITTESLCDRSQALLCASRSMICSAPCVQAAHIPPSPSVHMTPVLDVYGLLLRGRYIGLKMTDRVVILTTESIDGSINQSVKRSLI